MAQTLGTSHDDPLEISQEIILSLSPSSPKALNLPPAIVFAPAPTVLTDHTIPCRLILITDRPAPLVRPQRRFRIERYEIAIISLMLSCAALCIHRLIWATQP